MAKLSSTPCRIYLALISLLQMFQKVLHEKRGASLLPNPELCSRKVPAWLLHNSVPLAGQYLLSYADLAKPCKW